MPEWVWLLVVVATSGLITWAWRPDPKRLLGHSTFEERDP